jgi:hypothetical protein
MSDIESAKYWLSWIEFGGTIALLLVALGVGYEFVADRLAAPLRKRLETAQQSEMLKLQNETGSLTEKVAEANARAAEANQKAETEHLARVRIEQQIAARVLTSIQSDRIAEDIKQFAGQSLTVLRTANDDEIWEYSRQIAAVLRRAGWNVELDGITSMPLNTGILILVRQDDPKSIMAATALQNSLGACDISAPAQYTDEPLGKIELVVGSKPQN